jgi:hypothetical protein
VLSASTGSLGAQASKFEGAWRYVSGRFTTPDTSYDLPMLNGLAVIHGRYLSQTFSPSPPNGVEQAGELRDADAKAARYDAVIANAATLDVREKTPVARFVQALQPELVGQSLTYEYHARGDTLFMSRTDPWAKDKTKLTHSSLVFVRVPPKQASVFDGAWRHISTDYTAPDTSFHRSALKGLLVVNGLFYSRTFAVDPAGEPRALSTSQEKAARYDAVIGNAGMFTLEGKTPTQHIEEAVDPAGVRASSVIRYRFHGDTLFTTVSEPWAKDSSKVVTLKVNFVRLR